MNLHLLSGFVCIRADMWPVIILAAWLPLTQLWFTCTPCADGYCHTQRDFRHKSRCKAHSYPPCLQAQYTRIHICPLWIAQPVGSRYEQCAICTQTKTSPHNISYLFYNHCDSVCHPLWLLFSTTQPLINNHSCYTHKYVLHSSTTFTCSNHLIINDCIHEEILTVCNKWFINSLWIFWGLQLWLFSLLIHLPLICCE